MATSQAASSGGVVFDPGSGGMKAFIARGDLYLEPDRWTTRDIERLTE